MSRFDVRRKEDLRYPFEKVEGIKKLANWVEKLLLTSYGSDSKNPDSGCYLKAMVSNHYDSLEDIARDIDREVKRVEEQIKAIQRDEARKGISIPPSERLSALNLVDVYETTEGTDLWGVQATYEVVNREGERLENTIF
jgi:phage baseplate assembly protein W